jgi:hypothetical protein
MRNPYFFLTRQSKVFIFFLPVVGDGPFGQFLMRKRGSVVSCPNGAWQLTCRWIMSPPSPGGIFPKP